MCTKFIKNKNPINKPQPSNQLDSLQWDKALDGQAKELVAQLEMRVFIFLQKKKVMQPHKAATETAKGKYALRDTS